MASRPTHKRNASEVFLDPTDRALYMEMGMDERVEFESELMRERQAKFRRFDSIAGVYQTADSILTNSSITVRAGDFTEIQSKAVAWSDGANIYLNAELLDDISDESIISLNGVNYHEVAHLLWTPRKGTEFMKTIMSENLLQYFNVLEDSRIENFMVTKFPSTKLSLVKSSLTYLIENCEPTQIANAYPVICGRTHLPIKVRQAVANEFVSMFGSELATRISAIANEYRTLSLPVKVESDRALELVREFASLIKFDSNNSQPRQGEDGKATLGEASPCSEREPMKSGKYQSGKKQSEIADNAVNGEQENLDGNSKSDQEPKQGNKSDQKSKLDDNSASTGIGGNSDKLAKSDNNPVADESIADLLREAISEVMNNQEVKAEAKQVRNAIRASDKSFTGMGKAGFRNEPADIEAKSNAKAFSNELIQLQIDNDPAWQRHVPAGKLNIQRTMNMDINDINILFDRWDTGNDNFDIEAVVLVDNSGSMQSMMSEACKSAWTIKRALESIEARTTVYTFDDETKLLYSADDKASINYRAVNAGGTTNPIEGLLEAENIFATTRRKTKLLLIVTDGEWYQEEQNNAIIKRINDIEGAVTSVVFIGSAWYLERYSKQEYIERVKKWQHGCQTFTLVNRPREIVNVARDIVRSLSRR